mmetsp:Transcript_39274/g.71941  ORF Transcript_39274/g.71941 Transcript_39274/m.71941 type:complete len:448 (+) Transcript_39274:70-1413(+)
MVNNAPLARRLPALNVTGETTDQHQDEDGLLHAINATPREYTIGIRDSPIIITMAMALAFTVWVIPLIFPTIGLHFPHPYKPQPNEVNKKKSISSDPSADGYHPFHTLVQPSNGATSIVDTTVEQTSIIGNLSNNQSSSFFKSVSKFFGKNITKVNPHIAFRPIRPEAVKVLHNWSYVAKEVIATGHPWCSLYRDNWSCAGERYKKVLLQTPLFNRSFDLNVFPSDSNIYMDGNSFMGELVYTVICNTENVDTWLLGGVTGNSLLVRSLQSNVTLLLICNHPELQHSPNKTMELLKSANFIPDYIVRGKINKANTNATPEEMHSINFSTEHRDTFLKEFPNASYLKYPGRRLPSTCRADFQNCHEKKGKHTCLPGPVNTYAQDFVHAIMSSSNKSLPGRNPKPRKKGRGGIDLPRNKNPGPKRDHRNQTRQSAATPLPMGPSSVGEH